MTTLRRIVYIAAVVLNALWTVMAFYIVWRGGYGSLIGVAALVPPVVTVVALLWSLRFAMRA